MNIEKVVAVETDHCPQSHGWLLQSKKHGDILYSGDTLPCQNLLNYAQDVKVLIHEATLNNGLEKDAISKKHTTTGQALKIANTTRAWRTILTHFSPRVNKTAEITHQHFKTKTLVAFDHLRVNISELEWAYEIQKVYDMLLSNDSEESEGKS